MKKIFKILGVVILCGVLIAACSSKSGGDKKEPTKTEYAQGETATHKKVEYTVTGVERTQGNQYLEAEAGKEYVVVHIKIVNKSDDKVAYNPMDWKMQNSQGQESGYDITPIDTVTALHSGDLLAGGTIEGDLVFEETIGDTGLKLAYYSNIFESKSAFTIKID